MSDRWRWRCDEKGCYLAGRWMLTKLDERDLPRLLALAERQMAKNRRRLEGAVDEQPARAPQA